MFRYMGHEIEADEKYRPEKIKVDGIEYSASLHAERHGYSWKASPSGNDLYFESECGLRMMIPQKVFRDRA